jgi:outer membrane protein OmpA-like peptidoglycan-associated protein
MNPRYYHSDSAQRDRWVVSYVDVLTILLTFFVAAAARTLPVKTEPAEPIVASALNIIDARPVAKDPVAKDPIEETLIRSGLSFRREQRGLVISLPQIALFASGDDRIRAEAYPLIEQIAGVVRGIPNEILLIGHADSNPINNRRFRNNWELSAARGLRLLQMLHTRYDIDEGRMSIASEGANRPAAPNDTAEGRAGNRRVEIVILQETNDLKSEHRSADPRL